MKMVTSLSVMTFLIMFFNVMPSYANDMWAGNFQVQITRATTDACLENGSEIFALDANRAVMLGDWAYTQATVASLCVDVYVPGVTEYFRTDIPQYLSVEGVLVDGNGVSRKVTAQYVRHAGNNAIYEIKLLNLALKYDETLSRQEKMSEIKLYGSTFATSYTKFLAISVFHNF